MGLHGPSRTTASNAVGSRCFRPCRVEGHCVRRVELTVCTVYTRDSKDLLEQRDNSWPRLVRGYSQHPFLPQGCLNDDAGSLPLLDATSQHFAPGIPATKAVSVKSRPAPPAWVQKQPKFPDSRPSTWLPCPRIFSCRPSYHAAIGIGEDATSQVAHHVAPAPDFPCARKRPNPKRGR